jgi:hypothetical protein
LNLSIIFYSSKLKNEIPRNKKCKTKAAQNKKPTLCEWAKFLFAEIAWKKRHSPSSWVAC